MAREELGTKRACPETGRKFYDLNNDPIVSPYTGTSYPLSYFEGEKEKTPVTPAKKEAVEETETETEAEADTGDAELVSLEDADAEASGEDIPDIEDSEDDNDIGNDDDSFLEEEEEDGDDIGIVVGVDDEEE